MNGAAQPHPPTVLLVVLLKEKVLDQDSLFLSQSRNTTMYMKERDLLAQPSPWSAVKEMTAAPTQITSGPNGFLALY